MDTDTPEKMLTPSQAAQRLGISRRSLSSRRLAGTGPTPYVEISPGRFRYPESSVLAWIAARTVGGEDDAPFVAPGDGGE